MDASSPVWANPKYLLGQESYPYSSRAWHGLDPLWVFIGLTAAR